MTVILGRLAFVVFIWAYALVYYLECRALPDASENLAIGAVFWSFTAIALSELTILARRLRASGFKPSPPAADTIRRILADSRLHLAVLIAFYLASIPWLGFYLASFLSFVAFSLALGSRRPGRILLTGILILGAIYLIFTWSLKLVLPPGLLF